MIRCHGTWYGSLLRDSNRSSDFQGCWSLLRLPHLRSGAGAGLIVRVESCAYAPPDSRSRTVCTSKTLEHESKTACQGYCLTWSPAMRLSYAAPEIERVMSQDGPKLTPDSLCRLRGRRFTTTITTRLCRGPQEVCASVASSKPPGRADDVGWQYASVEGPDERWQSRILERKDVMQPCT